MSPAAFTVSGMSPASPRKPRSHAQDAALHRLLSITGTQIHTERIGRRLSLRDLAGKAGLSVSAVQSIEAGEAGSIDAYVRLSLALGRRAELLLVDPRRKADSRPNLGSDPVHSAMGEFEAGHLRGVWRTPSFGIGLDEPYQHYQFAGRADLVAWDLEAAALLHIENRTRFPDFQEMAAAFNAKKAYLGAALAERLGVRGWRSETHVIAALWSSEVLHALRLRPNSFRSICPDGTGAFESWWRGEPPNGGKSTTLVVLDPLASARSRAVVGLSAAMTVRPRYRGYAHAASALMRASG